MSRIAIALALAALATTAAAQVYRCTDATGKVYYGDAPCPAGARSAQVAAPSSNAEIELERERAQLARERFQLEQEKRAAREERQFAPASQNATPQRARVDSYECDVAKKNLGVGISKESKQRSEQEYEAACFGDRAADIQKARAGKSDTKIFINTNR